MKTIINLFLSTLLLASAILTQSCTKETIDTANARFSIATPPPYYAGEEVTFVFESKSEKMTIYLGTNGREYKNYPDDMGSAVTDIVFVNTYNRPGTYTVTSIAGNYGDYGNKYNMDVFEMELTIIEKD